jgi:hypothetical protein
VYFNSTPKPVPAVQFRTYLRAMRRQAARNPGKARPRKEERMDLTNVADLQRTLRRPMEGPGQVVLPLIVTTIWLSFHRNQRTSQTTLFSDLFGAAIYIATALVVLNSVFSLPVNGLLATSGVVAIVLGLALQNTLADVFAGMAVGVEAPFSVGDRNQIDEKIEGQVVQVNWRSIRIQTDGDDIAIIPNSQIAKAQIVNPC